jgi:DNA polymerase-1
MSAISAQLGGRDVTIHEGAGDLPPIEAGRLGLDVETTYMDDRAQWAPDFRVRTVQLATTDEAWVFDLSDEHQRTRVEIILNDPRRSFCSHTNMDVLSVWREFGINIAPRNVDTRGLAIMADPDRNEDRDLKTLATAYGMPELAQAEAEKDRLFRELWPGKKNAKRSEIDAHGWANVDVTNPIFVVYAALDAIACRRLVDLLVPATSNPPELLRVDQWLHVKANEIQMRGHCVDVPWATSLRDEAEAAVTEAKREAQEICGINIAGPKLVPWLAEQGVDWDTWERRTPTGNPSIEKDDVPKLLSDYTLTEAGCSVVLELQQMKTWMDALNKARSVLTRLDSDNRIHPLLNPVGATTTARMSSAGPNMQNFSKSNPRQRGMFIPEPGHTLVSIDFDQVELRVVAALAREEKMIETILAGGDLHQLTVDELAAAGVTITRQTAKIVNFLIVYGGGGKALHDQTGIPIDEAYAIVNAWRDRYTGIQALAQYMALRRDEVRTISHRRLPVTTNRKTGDLRAYANINYLVQSSARELLVDAWQRLDGRHAGVVWWPIHDELVLQVPTGDLDRVLPDAEEAMTLDFMGVPITATAVPLIDEHGVSRWMSGDHAEKIAKEKVPA